MSIGNRIKERRIELGLSADDLASRIGKSRATVYRYENGDIENMPTTILEPLAKALETTPADLMGWNITIEFKTSKSEDIGLKRLITYFEALTDIGKKKALDNIEDLSKIYSRNDCLLNAAHANNPTPEQKANADRIMEDDSEWE